MKTNEFFEMMGDIDCSLIERADGKRTRTHRPMLKIAAIAASFAVLIVGLVFALPMLIDDDGGDQTPGDAIVWENVFELFDPGKGGGKIYEEGAMALEYSFAEINGAKYAKYKLGNCFPKERGGEFVGKKLDAVTVTTGWRYNFEREDRDVKTVDAEVCEIKGVSPDAAVAIRYAEASASYSTEYYYVALNTEYECDSLSEFFDDFNASVHMEIGKEAYAIEYDFNNSGDSIEKYRLNDGVPSDICKLLLGFDASAEAVGVREGVDAKIRGCDDILRIQFEMRSAGRKINFLYVMDNGYIAIQGIGEGYTLFNVGVHNTDKVFRMVESGSELVTVIPADPDGDGLVEVTTSAAVNEVVPE